MPLDRKTVERVFGEFVRGRGKSDKEKREIRQEFERIARKVERKRRGRTG